jgi:nicotinamidase-related amidase
MVALPPAPAPVRVTLPAAASALLLLDVTESFIENYPRCREMLPRVESLVAAARLAGATVLHSANHPGLGAPLIQPPFAAPVAPAEGELIVIGGGQDRFFATLLDELLRRRGIANLVLAGWRINGSLLYTAVGANLRGYTVVVADDATSASNDYDIAVGHYQLLTQLNANPRNEPLRKGAVTLSRTDLIAFT